MISSPATYLDALARAGLVTTSPQSKRDFALQFFDQITKKKAENKPPALGLHLVMGTSTHQKIKNVQKQIKQGVLTPVTITATHEIVS